MILFIVGGAIGMIFTMVGIAVWAVMEKENHDSYRNKDGEGM